MLPYIYVYIVRSEFVAEKLSAIAGFVQQEIPRLQEVTSAISLNFHQDDIQTEYITGINGHSFKRKQLSCIISALPEPGKQKLIYRLS